MWVIINPPNTVQKRGNSQLENEVVEPGGPVLPCAMETAGGGVENRGDVGFDTGPLAAAEVEFGAEDAGCSAHVGGRAGGLWVMDEREVVEESRSQGVG